MLLKNFSTVVIAGTEGQAYRPYSRTCPPAPSPPDVTSGDGPKGCYVKYVLRNSVTHQTVGVTVAYGQNIPPPYDENEWGVVSFQQVCY